MAKLREDGILVERWEPVFRHSAGRLSSQFFTAIRSERRLLGWKTKRPETISVPPKNFGPDGEWVGLGPEATLLSAAPPAWVAESGEPLLRTFALGRVLVDGAETPMYALLKLDQRRPLPERGARLSLRFADAAPLAATPTGCEFWFEIASPAGGVGAAS
jgi:hypothetical protein